MTPEEKREKDLKLAAVKELMTEQFKKRIRHVTPLVRDAMVRGFIHGLHDAFGAMHVATHMINEGKTPADIMPANEQDQPEGAPI
jgi:hypothetical protein